MTKRPIITHPSYVLRTFTEAYKQLTPATPVSDEWLVTADSVINDIILGNEITISKMPECKGGSKGARCSAVYVQFMGMLISEMQRQECYRVSPTRTAELLYNFDESQPYSQPIMRLSNEGQRLILRSTRQYSKDVKLELDIPWNRESFDWELNDYRMS